MIVGGLGRSAQTRPTSPLLIQLVGSPPPYAHLHDRRRGQIKGGGHQHGGTRFDALQCGNPEIQRRARRSGAQRVPGGYVLAIAPESLPLLQENLTSRACPLCGDRHHTLEPT